MSASSVAGAGPSGGGQSAGQWEVAQGRRHRRRTGVPYVKEVKRVLEDAVAPYDAVDSAAPDVALASGTVAT